MGSPDCKSFRYLVYLHLHRKLDGDEDVDSDGGEDEGEGRQETGGRSTRHGSRTDI